MARLPRGGPERLQIREGRDYRIAHFTRTDTLAPRRIDIAGTQPLIQHQADRLFDGFGRGMLFCRWLTPEALGAFARA